MKLKKNYNYLIFISLTLFIFNVSLLFPQKVLIEFILESSTRIKPNWVDGFKYTEELVEKSRFMVYVKNPKHIKIDENSKPIYLFITENTNVAFYDFEINPETITNQLKNIKIATIKKAEEQIPKLIIQEILNLINLSETLKNNKNTLEFRQKINKFSNFKIKEIVNLSTYWEKVKISNNDRPFYRMYTLNSINENVVDNYIIQIFNTLKIKDENYIMSLLNEIKSKGVESEVINN